MKNQIEAVKRSIDKLASMQAFHAAGILSRRVVGVNHDVDDSSSVSRWRVKPRYGYGGRGHLEVSGDLSAFTIPGCDYVTEEHIDIICEYRVWVGRKFGNQHEVFHVDRKHDHQSNEQIGLRNNFYYATCADMKTRFSGVREMGLEAVKAVGLNVAAVDVCVFQAADGSRVVEPIETNTRPAMSRDGIADKWQAYKGE